jgi:hypothetical protein
MSSEYHIERDPETVIVPDVTYVRPDLLMTAEGRCYPSFSPDVAVIIVGWPDTPMVRRPNVQRYLQTGSRSVLFAQIDGRVLTVEHADGRSEVLREGDVFDGGDVMPGFRLPSADFFR